MDRFAAVDWPELNRAAGYYLESATRAHESPSSISTLAHYTMGMLAHHITPESLQRVPKDQLKHRSFPQFVMLSEKAPGLMEVDQWITERTLYLTTAVNYALPRSEGLNRLQDLLTISPHSYTEGRDIIIHRAPHTGLCTFDAHRLPQVTISATNDIFEELFNIHTSNILRGFSFQNCIVAGGSVIAALIQPDSHYYGEAHARAYRNMDVDIFFHGTGLKEAFETIKELEEVIKHNIGEAKPMYVCAMSTAITFVPPKPFPRVQAVLRMGRSVGHVLVNFDIGVPAVAWDGEEVMLHDRACYEIITGYIKLDPHRINNDGRYLARLLHYARRGFGTSIDRSDMMNFPADVLNNAFGRLAEIQPNITRTLQHLDQLQGGRTAVKISYKEFSLAAEANGYPVGDPNGNSFSSLSAFLAHGELFNSAAVYANDLELIEERSNTVDYADEEQVSGARHPYWHQDHGPIEIEVSIKNYNKFIADGTFDRMFGSTAIAFATAHAQLVPREHVVHVLGSNNVATILEEHAPLRLPLVIPMDLIPTINHMVKAAMAEAGFRHLPVLVPIFPVRSTDEEEIEKTYQFILWYVYPQLAWTGMDPRIDAVNKVLNAFRTLYGRLLQPQTLNAETVLTATEEVYRKLDQRGGIVPGQFEYWLRT